MHAKSASCAAFLCAPSLDFGVRTFLLRGLVANAGSSRGCSEPGRFSGDAVAPNERSATIRVELSGGSLVRVGICSEGLFQGETFESGMDNALDSDWWSP